MFKNYFLTAWRSIKKSKGYSALNILGLAAGMAVALLIGLWVIFEYSYDRWVPGYEDLYRVKLSYTYQGESHTQDAVSLPVSDVLRKDIPGIKYVAESDWMDSHGLVNGDKKVYIDGGMVGGDFLKMFPYPLLKGNAATCLADPYSIVLSESTARSLFGRQDPMNRMIRLDNAHDVKVTGILKDLPKNSSMGFHYLVPFSYREINEDWIKDGRTRWTNNSFQIFVALAPNASFDRVSANIKNIVYDHAPEMKAGHLQISLHPMKDWHLYSEFKNGKAAGGFIDYVRLFTIIGVLVLLIACINFMNLTTARSEKRAREVGVRKAIGSLRSDLIIQFLTESVLITFFSFLVCLLLVQAILPAFNKLVDSDIRIPFDRPVFWEAMMAYVLITGLLAGSRPAFYLSSFQPVKVLKGAIRAGRSASNFGGAASTRSGLVRNLRSLRLPWLSRKILVVLQFTCSIGLIISTIIVYRQLQHAKDRPKGYDLQRLMTTDMSDDLNSKFPALRDELLRSGVVEHVAAASSPATGVYSHTDVSGWPGKTAGEEAVSIGAIMITKDYFTTMGMELSSGRELFGDFAKDSATVIVNESAVRRMHLKAPVGQIITWNGGIKATIIGVVKDAVMDSPFSPVEPVIFFASRWYQFMLYRLSPGIKVQEAITRLAPIFMRYNPAYPYIYQFVDRQYASKFWLESLIGQLAGIFAGLAILISCLGLFGLAAYMAEQRRKEIGIRKVLGASVLQLWLLLSGDFVLLVGISVLIASPISWYYLRSWLQGYEYRISIGISVFVMAAVLALLITVITVSFQSIRAALNNPVKSLRTE